MTQWILIADASGARVFATAGRNAPLELVREIANPKGRERTQELTTDAPGRVSKAGAPGTRSATEPRTTAHDAAADQFARRLAETLRQELARGSYDSLAVAAPPHFLGRLRTLLDKGVEQRWRASTARDLVHLTPDELRPHIDALLGPGVFA